MTYVHLTWLADVLRAEGCKVKEYDDWKNRGRPSSSGQFNPYGVDLHHTGTKTSYSNPNPTLSTCVHGRPDLSGPLCQVMIGYDGVCHVIAAGRANHGGEHSGAGPFPPGDCNAMMVGIEVDYSGSQAVSPEQGDAAIRATAAILRKFNKNETYCLGHKETSVTGKWDPGKEGPNSSLYKMSNVRELVKDALAGQQPYPAEEDSDMKAKDQVALNTSAENFLEDRGAGVGDDHALTFEWFVQWMHIENVKTTESLVRQEALLNQMISAQKQTNDLLNKLIAASAD